MWALKRKFLQISLIRIESRLAYLTAELASTTVSYISYFGQHHPKIIEFVNQLSVREQKSFIFSTHGNPLVSKYHDALRFALTRKGRTVIGEFDTVGFDGTGPF